MWIGIPCDVLAMMSTEEEVHMKVMVVMTTVKEEMKLQIHGFDGSWPTVPPMGHLSLYIAVGKTGSTFYYGDVLEIDHVKHNNCVTDHFYYFCYCADNVDDVLVCVYNRHIMTTSLIA